MIKWNDTSSWSKNATERSQPKEWTALVGIFRLVVHRHIHYPPDVWLASCHPKVFTRRELASQDVDEAKNQALAILKAVCEEALYSMAGE